MMVLYSMTLINSLLSHATPAHWVELTSSLERLNTSRAVIRLMSSHILEDLTNSILDYQGNMVRVIYFKKTRRVFVGGHFGMDEHEYGENAYAGDGEQDAMLDYIWTCAKLEVDDGSGTYLNGYGVGDGSAKSRGKGSVRDIVKWRKLGFETEDLRKEFDKTGMLGLECLVRLPLLAMCDANKMSCRRISYKQIPHGLHRRSWSRTVALQNGGVQLQEPRTKLSKFYRIIGLFSLPVIRPRQPFNRVSLTFIGYMRSRCSSSSGCGAIVVQQLRTSREWPVLSGASGF